MAWFDDGCPQCSQRLINSRFDATFRLADGDERLCFGVPAGLCQDCQQLYVDPDVIDLLELPSGRCVFAIESDLVMQGRAWTGAE